MASDFDCNLKQGRENNLFSGVRMGQIRCGTLGDPGLDWIRLDWMGPRDEYTFLKSTEED